MPKYGTRFDTDFFTKLELYMKHRRVLCMIITALLLLAVFAGCSPAEPQEEPQATANGMIPIVSITADSLSGWTGKKDIRSATLTYYDPDSTDAFTRAITIRPQGTSSLGYDKKNFTIEMTEEGVMMQEAWGVQSSYCLKADYIDPTHAGNVVSAKLAAQMQAEYNLFPDAPNRGLIDGFPVWVFLNGENAGLYSWNIPKSAWMFGMDDGNADHLVLCGENWSPSTSFYDDRFLPEEEWSFEVGEGTEENIEKFNRLLRFINSSSDEEFMAHFDEYLNLDACLNYYCFALVTHAADNMGKNTLMATYDGLVWSPSLYDLDSLWGLDYMGTGMMEDIVPLQHMAEGGSNHLLERLLKLYADEFSARYKALRDGVLSIENIKTAFESYCSAIPAICYEMDSRLWNADGSRIRTLELVLRETEANLQFLDEIFLP